MRPVRGAVLSQQQTDVQRVDTFFRRSKCCGFCPADLQSFVEMLEDADDRLFNKINNNEEHVLHCLLPPRSVAPQRYELRQ